MSAHRFVRYALAATALMSTPAFAQGPAAPTPANPWFQAAPFPEPSEEVLGATANGKLYVFAGLAPGWKPKAFVFEYDPSSNQWSKKKPMKLASHHVAFTSLNNKIYAFGGFVLPEAGPAAWKAVNNAWEYDPASDEWKELAPMPTKRGAAAAAAAGGKLYVTGGANSLPGVPAASAQCTGDGRGRRPSEQRMAQRALAALAAQSPRDGGRRRQDLRDRRPGWLRFHLRYEQQRRSR